jgi:hypothetical protein
MTSELMAEILNVTQRRAPFQGHRAKVLHLQQLVDARAWTDAALALIELELPLWHIRRIAYDAGEWHCALSRQCELPDWLDQAVESRHANLTLAILSTFVEAQGTVTAASRASVPSVSSGGEATCNIPVCCDNFFSCRWTIELAMVPQFRDLPQGLASSRVLIRFGVRMIILAAFAASSSIGFARGLATLMLMAITLSSLIAIIRRERPFQSALNYWDETVAYDWPPSNSYADGIIINRMNQVVP